MDKIKIRITKDEHDSDSIGLGIELESGLGVFDAFFASLSMIIVSEILSTGLGRIVPNLISRKHTNSAATVWVRICCRTCSTLVASCMFYTCEYLLHGKMETGSGHSTSVSTGFL